MVVLVLCGLAAASASETAAGQAHKQSSPTAKGPIPEHVVQAARTGELVVLQRELDEKPDLVHRYDAKGYTLLHHASDDAQEVAAGLLLQRGADVNLRTRDVGLSPLILACNRLQRAHGLMDLLIAAGAELDAQDAHLGVSGLMIAADGGDEELVQKLLRAGARVAARDRRGRRPSQFARERGHVRLAARLAGLEQQQAAAAAAQTAQASKAAVAEEAAHANKAAAPRMPTTIYLGSRNGIACRHVTVERQRHRRGLT